MPHDRLNRELKPGDRVVMVGTVQEVYAGSAVCNLVVQPEHALADPEVFRGRLAERSEQLEGAGDAVRALGGEAGGRPGVVRA